MPHSIHGLSLRSVPLSIRCNSNELMTATGHFWSWENDRTFLVSNWHVFAGCNPNTKEAPLGFGSGYPTEVAYPRFINAVDLHEREWDMVKLQNDDGGNRWLQHHFHGSSVDVAVIEVPTRNDKGYVQSIEPFV